MIRYVPDPSHPSGTPGTHAQRNESGNGRGNLAAVVDGGQQAREVGQGWIRNHKLLVGVMAVVAYVMLARTLGSES